MELAEAIFKVHKALKSLPSFQKHGILSLLYRRVELDQLYDLLRDLDAKFLLVRQYLEMTNEFDELLKRNAGNVANEIYTRYRNYLRLLNVRKLRSRLLDHVSAKSSLTVSVANDLSRMEFVTSEGSRVEIDDPKLLWECSCHVPPAHVRPGVHCKLHANAMGDRIAAAFGSGLVRIEYDGLSFYWKDIRTLWPPSIDSLHFATVLSKSVSGKQLRRMLDVGSGTGFLGLCLAAKKGPIKKVVLSDLFMTSLFSSLYSAYRNLSPVGLGSVRLEESNGLENFRETEDRFDMVVCAPPYVPHLGVPSILSLDAVSGTYLMRDVVVRSGKFSNLLMICHSSIAQPEFEKAVGDAKRTYARLYVDYLSELEVPFWGSSRPT